MELQRNPFLINRALSKFLTASVFSAVAIQLAAMIDSISMGGTLLISKAIGENNMEHGSHIAAVAVVLLMSAGLVLVVTGGLFSDWLVSLLCSDASIADYATTYLRLFFLLELVPLFIYNAVCGFTEADGHPQVVTRAVIIAGIANVLLDLLFVGVFHWGISGAMYATVGSDLIVVAILCRHLYQHSSLRCHMPSKGFLSISREIFAEGIPLTVGDMALMSGFMVLNSAIIYIERGRDVDGFHWRLPHRRRRCHRSPYDGTPYFKYSLLSNHFVHFGHLDCAPGCGYAVWCPWR